MKKVYFLAVSLLLGAGAIAQTTVTNHFEGAVADPMPGNWQVGTYMWTGGTTGYVSGTNFYEDKAVLQLFDANYGVIGAGTINNVKMHIDFTNDVGNSTLVTVGVWANDNGTPGALLGSADIELASINTGAGNTQNIVDGTTVKGIYNLDITFATPIAIPANESYFAGITLPTVSEMQNGDTLVVTTTLDGGNYQFADAGTHAGRIDQTDAWADYGNFNYDIANAIFPTMTFTSSVNEENLDLTIYPNPAQNVLNIDAAESLSSVKVIGMDGKVVIDEEINGNTTSIDISSIEAGSYYYEVVSIDGIVSRNSFVKK
jgi:hypothetical protein